MRLIDADEAKRRIVEFTAGCHPEVLTVDSIVMLLDKTPTVDASPVVHGRWIEKIDMVESYLADSTEVFYECSVCASANIGESPYCPCCGAKMDGGAGNG